MKVAALDFGSNTFLCLIAEVTEEGLGTIYSDEVEMVRLGQGLNQNKKFHPEALERADRCMQKFAQTIAQHQPEKILAMATSAARDAENKDELFQLAQKHGIPLEIIAGDKEATITYQGAVSAQTNPQQGLLVIDIGGGSTEFIFGQGPKLLTGKSFDIGCVRLTEKFITAQPTSDTEVQNVVQSLDKALNEVRSLMPLGFQLDTILAVAGTPTALAAADLGYFDAAKIDGYELTEEMLAHWVQRLQKATVEEKIKMGIPEGRADVILIGALTLWRALKIFQQTRILVSTRGVRYGVALEIARRAHSTAHTATRA
ncbi:Ppx/GppA phosphatase family protein [Pseudobdellovibrio exovorus]|uniref:Ppx/GppA phosphatase N-terminal domain-containing protein n=1 Tax=Pseudobdellovibrio exovorus JSS TaxID=1184267 RepID=M4V532_9BACT|nr:Ppx/GppA phosphatase family protein [Pseudobdellovibrio exovorus]AGH94293.1 hypothetical protein A11Q_73 [Pseudobdellovibrio exovorus JSS]